MRKRYQVFVSSTYTDLIEERGQVMESLLKLNCIPAGMELFPAADEDAWALIKDVIDECDYYLLILAGRYGSCASDGIGYTEKEYRYALEKGKRIIAFLHADPGKIPQENCEREHDGRAKLEAFRELAKKKLVRMWSDKHQLAKEVTTSLVDLIYRHPGIGWVRADQVPPDDIAAEAIRLRKRVDELEGQLSELAKGPPPGSELLEQGTDSVGLDFNATLPKVEGQKQSESRQVNVTTTYDDVLRHIAKLLLESPTESNVRDRLASAFHGQALSNLGVPEISSLSISSDTIENLRIQFRAIGIVTQELETSDEESVRGRFFGRYTYFRWFLTTYGDRVVTQILAKRRGG